MMTMIQERKQEWSYATLIKLFIYALFWLRERIVEKRAFSPLHFAEEKKLVLKINNIGSQQGGKTNFSKYVCLSVYLWMCAINRATFEHKNLFKPNSHETFRKLLIRRLYSLPKNNQRSLSAPKVTSAILKDTMRPFCSYYGKGEAALGHTKSILHSSIPRLSKYLTLLKVDVSENSSD